MPLLNFSYKVDFLLTKIRGDIVSANTPTTILFTLDDTAFGVGFAALTKTNSINIFWDASFNLSSSSISSVGTKPMSTAPSNGMNPTVLTARWTWTSNGPPAPGVPKRPSSTLLADSAAAAPETISSTSSLPYQLPVSASLITDTSPSGEKGSLPAPHDVSVVPLFQNLADLSTSGTFPSTPLYSPTTIGAASTPEDDGRGDGEERKGVGGHPPTAGSSKREANATELGSGTEVPAAVFTGGAGRRYDEESFMFLVATDGFVVLLGVVLLIEAVSFLLDHYPID
ncbi:MAG: hypothetical protein Q9167_005861 [Letrouitia subvulpina]